MPRRKSNEIRVIIVGHGRSNYYMRYTDPHTGKRIIRSTGTRVRRDAERVAAKWEDDLRANRSGDGRIEWSAFVARYESEVLSGLAKSSDQKSSGALRTFQRLMQPARLGDINAGTLSQFVSKLRNKKRSEETIKSTLGSIHAAVNWAVSVHLIPAAPVFPKVQRAKKAKRMKGRPLTDAEFLKMLRVTPQVVGPKRSRHWRRLLRGIWLSGLRLSEAVDLWWDREDRLHIDLKGEFPMFSILSEHEKGNEDRLLPITPDFAEFLLRTPPADRAGRVFLIPKQKNRESIKRPGEVSANWVGKVITKIGKTAKIVVDNRRGRIKYASAHDLRRSFGDRWSWRVHPRDLQLLMRHDSIETTMLYYVRHDANDAAARIWEAQKGNTSGNTRRNRQSASFDKSA